MVRASAWEEKSSHNGKTSEVLGTPPLPPTIYPTVKETSPGTWCGVCGIPGPEVGVLEDVWSMDLGYGTLPDLLANYDGINHSFLTNHVAISGQSGGSYRTDGSIIVSGPWMRHLTGPGRGGTYFCETSP